MKIDVMSANDIAYLALTNFKHNNRDFEVDWHEAKRLRDERSCLSAVFDKLETAALISVPFDLIGIMFSGIYLNLASASPYFSWLRFVSGFYYGVECISILQWTSIRTINCDTGERPCIRTGSGVLDRFGYDEGNFLRNCLCLGLMYVVMHTLAFIMVIRRSKKTPIY